MFSTGLASSEATTTSANSSATASGRPTPPRSVRTQPASVSVSVTCQTPLQDLLIPGLGGSRTLSARAVSPLDTYRERQ